MTSPSANSTYATPADSVEIEYEIKKSRFIARASAAADRQQAMALLADMRAAYPDARHHCWAYLLGNPESAASAAMGDDGEPSGTAGKPILNVLQHKGVGDVMVVVARYFGGIKLGAGGLVRAYSSAAQQAMEVLPTQQAIAMAEQLLSADFATEQSIRHWLSQQQGEVLAIEYGEQITMRVQVPVAQSEALKAFALANRCQLLDD